MKIKKLKDSIFPSSVYLVIFNTEEELAKKFNVHLEDKHDACVFDLNGKIYLAVRPDVTLKILVHECVHVVNYIFADCGQKLDVNNDEVQCYLTEFIFDQAYKILFKELTVENKKSQD
jgi:hypothetical protein